MLYMPGANARALQKAQSLDCDGLIFDLEDAVAPTAKERARAQVVAALSNNDYGHRERIVRVNGFDSPWGEADLAACSELTNIDGVLIPKVERAEDIEWVSAGLAKGARPDLPIWLMIETPRGVLRLAELVAGNEHVAGLVLGSSDLVQELHGLHNPTRDALGYAIGHLLMIGRAYDLIVLDGVPLDFRDLNGLRQSNQQGRILGFDGRTLIHPDQLAPTNEVYGPSAEQIEQAGRIWEAWCQASAAGKGVVEVDGSLVENLHARDAQRVLEFAAAIERREG